MIEDTIFAPANGVGRAAIAVVRVSGPQAKKIIELFTHGSLKPRYASLRKFYHPASGVVLDEGLAFWFPGPQSFTGEDSAEFHLHGGRAIVTAMLDALRGLEGVRPAEAGEFTHRAFSNGRMDLTQVEGLADMIDSQTERQRQQAVNQFEGRLGNRVENWRAMLLQAQAMVAAEIDFGDEEDVPVQTLAQIRVALRPVLQDLETALRYSSAAEILREGLVVVIAGPPNVGKSSLLNRLAGRDVAIVSPQAGTTRDVLEVALEVKGVPIILVDTAGMRDTVDLVEAEGVARARNRARGADLVLWLEETGVHSRGPDLSIGPTVPCWRIGTKLDLHADSSSADTCLSISAHNGDGIEALLQLIANYVIEKLPGDDSGALTRDRHVKACQRSLEALLRIECMAEDSELEMVSADLQIATKALAQLIGLIDVEDVLGEIFSRFCIGK